MIFKCYICSNYYFWNKKTCYEVVVTSNNGTQELFKKKICRSCGEGIDEVYESGKKLADMEMTEEDGN